VSAGGDERQGHGRRLIFCTRNRTDPFRVSRKMATLRVLEHLWKVAYVLHPEVAEERESWVMDRTTAILEGRAQDVAVGLRRAATRKQLGQSERKPVDKAADYIDNNQERLQYDQALAYGLPIATGVIEGACHYPVVEDRMDITGARWGWSGLRPSSNFEGVRKTGFDSRISTAWQLGPQNSH